MHFCKQSSFYGGFFYDQATAKFCSGPIILWVWKETDLWVWKETDIMHFCKQSSFYGIFFTTMATVNILWWYYAMGLLLSVCRQNGFCVQ